MKRFFKNLTVGFAVYCVLIFSVVGYGASSLPDEYTVADNGKIELGNVYSVYTDVSDSAAVSTGQSEYTAEIKALGTIPVKDIKVSFTRRQYVNLGGNIIGIKMYTDGVIVVNVDKVSVKKGSVTPGTDAGLREGDIITAVENTPVNSSKEFSAMIEKSQGKALQLSVLRGTREYSMQMTPALSTSGKYKAGIWVRDSSAGVGTVTYTVPDGGFVALGHAVCDVDTGELMPLSQGEAVEAGIKGIYKGSSDLPGELCGMFTGVSVGRLTGNFSTGIYGKFDDEEYLKGKTVAVARPQEIKEGKAQILCTVDESGPQYYDIEITRLYSPSDTANRNMVIKVTDERLIEKTGGIVQGMSGSPIIQNSMLAGAVTHVFISDPTQGYGVFATNMLEAAQ